METALQIILSALASFLAVKWVYFRVLKIAKNKQIVDNPNARKLQKTPVPILGGVAVFFGVLAGLLVGASVCWLVEGEPLIRLLPVVCAMNLMIYVGAMDDVIGLTPKQRLVIEFLTMLGLIYAGGGCIDSLHGFWGIDSYSWWFAVPFTVFVGVGIINSVNMIDGVNGLSSGLCILCSCMFGIAFLWVKDLANATLAFSMAASLLLFLFHNVFGNKSRMFIGDAGTMMMGIMLTWFVICVLRSDTLLQLVAIQKNVNMVAMSLAILSVPVFDTVRVMVQRMAQGKSPFKPDKTHLHHMLIRVGFSHSITALTEIFIDALIVGIWAISVKSGLGLDMQFYLVALSSMLFVWGVYFILLRQELNHSDSMHLMTRFSIKSHLGHTKWWLRLQEWLDSPEERLADKAVEEEPRPVGKVDQFYHFDRSEPKSFKESDRKIMYGFIRGKAEVYIDDIKRRSGADPLRVDVLVREGIQDGFIQVIKEDMWGSPSIIAFIEES